MTKEFIVVSLHPGVTREQVADICGWPAKFADVLETTPAPTALELKTLRDLQARTKAAHEGIGSRATPDMADIDEATAIVDTFTFHTKAREVAAP